MRALRLSAAALLALAVAHPAAARTRHIYTGGKECIAIDSIRAKSAEADDRLILHANGSRAYISHLPTPCPNLMSVNNVAHVKLIPRGDRLCTGDKIQVSDDSILGAVGLGNDNDGKPATCTLGNFEPVSEMTLEESLRR
jgi:hypothetical protein